MKKTTTGRRTPSAKSSTNQTPPAPQVYHIPHEHFIVALSFLVISLTGIILTQGSADAAKLPVKAKVTYTTNCSDPDGLDVTSKGTVAQTKIDNSAKRVKSVTKKTDVCISKKVVREYFCGKNNVINSKIVSCPTNSECKQGACVNTSTTPTEVAVTAPPTTWCNTSEVTCQDSTGANLTATCNGDKRQYFECQGRDSAYIERGITAGLKDPYGNAIYESTGHCALVEKDCGINNHTCRINGTEKYPSCAFRDFVPNNKFDTATSSAFSLSSGKTEALYSGTDGSWCKQTVDATGLSQCQDSDSNIITTGCNNGGSTMMKANCGVNHYSGNNKGSHARCFPWITTCSSNQKCDVLVSSGQAICHSNDTGAKLTPDYNNKFTSCTETDGGDTKTVQGTITIKDSTDKTTMMHADKCYSRIVVNEYNCVDRSVSETLVQLKVTTCDSGTICQNGACIVSSTARTP